MVNFFKNRTRILAIFLASFLVAVHYASITYLNSSLLSQTVGNRFINIPYIIGSFFSIIILFLAPFLVKKYGSVKTFAFFVLIQILSVFGMGFIGIAILTVLFFVIHHAGESMLNFFMDLNIEQETKKENTTGRMRGSILTAQNIAWVLSPLLLSLLVKESSLSRVYLLSSIVLIPLLFIIFFFFKNTKEALEKDSDTAITVVKLLKGGDTTRIISIQFILNLFYSWMVIYLPLLLHNEMNINWEKIGLIFTIMLLPFLLFQLPVGILSDRKTGEKELLVIGLIIISLSTFFIPQIKSASLLVWGSILFLTRVGASIVEISSESYFFKHVKEKDTAVISVFRTVRPFSFLIVPLITSPIIYFYTYSASFYFLAGITLMGLFFIPKVDTR